MQTKPTPYADINDLLDQLLSQMQVILGNRLVGLYLFGSLVAGDFDYDASDVDLVAAISTELTEKEFEQLEAMHLDIMNRYKRWDNRIEIGYIAVENLQKVQTHHPIALISPGEPFHIKVAENDWLINRSVLYEKGIALYGPLPQMIAVPIPQEIRKHVMQKIVQEWRDWIQHAGAINKRPAQAFVILTMCRMLYTFKQGAFVSKKQAALWAMQELPEWTSLIRDALLWRDDWRNEDVNHDATVTETLRFVHFTLGQCENVPGAT
ncbi:MAG: aminoglycoside adenylyltransferase domain-containing protein [Ktedonobacteraceae bacterium]